MDTKKGSLVSTAVGIALPLIAIVAIYTWYRLHTPDLWHGDSAKFSAGEHIVSCGVLGAGIFAARDTAVWLDSPTVLSCGNGIVTTTQ